ncbi:hypothetical protein MTO96_032134 [Rhipicephalus appendiculatus]
MGAARNAALWSEVTTTLNALGPAVKVVVLWRKYLARLCYDSRKAGQGGGERDEVTTLLGADSEMYVDIIYAFAGARGR